jgi:hypothetical protein
VLGVPRLPGDRRVPAGHKGHLLGPGVGVPGVAHARRPGRGAQLAGGLGGEEVDHPLLPVDRVGRRPVGEERHLCRRQRLARRSPSGLPGPLPARGESAGPHYERARPSQPVARQRPPGRHLPVRRRRVHGVTTPGCPRVRLCQPPHACSLRHRPCSDVPGGGGAGGGPLSARPDRPPPP